MSDIIQTKLRLYVDARNENPRLWLAPVAYKRELLKSRSSEDAAQLRLYIETENTNE